MIKHVVPVASLLGALSLGGCGGESAKDTVSFSAEVQPLLESRCGECHLPGGEGAEKTRFSVESYDAIIRGTRYGPVVDPGSAVSSTLWRLVAGKADPSIQMPHGREPLAPEQVDLIEAWIDQGARDN